MRNILISKKKTLKRIKKIKSRVTTLAGRLHTSNGKIVSGIIGDRIGIAHLSDIQITKNIELGFEQNYELCEYPITVTLKFCEGSLWKGTSYNEALGLGRIKCVIFPSKEYHTLTLF